MKPFKAILSNLSSVIGAAVAVGALMFASSAAAQLVAYDDAGNYQFNATANANWTNGANQGFGFTSWTIVTNGPNYHGQFIVTANNPTFVIATNVLGTNCVWGTYANGTNGLNQTVAFRGFTNSLATNTFKLQWGSTGAGNQNISGYGTVHGWCGFSLRTGNDTTQPYDYTDRSYDSTAMFYLYFLDGNSPATLYVWDGNSVWSVPNTSFSNLGRNNITNAIEAEVTPAADGQHYHLVLKDCVQNMVLFTTNSIFIGSGTIDSAALFCDDTTGDQIYNRMQITASTNIPPTIANLQPANGSLYVASGATNLSFEVDSFNSTVASSTVSIYLNGVLQAGSTFNTTSPTNQLLATNSTTLAADTFYNYTVVAQDANGNVVSNNYTFNTFLTNDLYIDAYDYNYSKGMFVNSSTPSNAYAGFLGTNGVDYSILDQSGTNNQVTYRTGDLVEILSLSNNVGGDPIDHANLRANGYTAYNIGFTDVGNWENYTRVMPVATNYSIYARAASGIGGQFEIEELTNSTATVSNQPLAALGRVIVPVTGGSRVYSGQLTPLTDIFGNTVVIPLAGTNTLRETAISSQGYNLEYLLVVAVTNATGTLRPYIAVGSPAPNATGVSTTSKISFTVVNRQTTVTNVQLFLNTTNVSAGLSLTNYTVGTLAFYNPTNLPPNATNTLMVVLTDSGGTKLTNSWIFNTTSTAGNGVWSGGASPDLTWINYGNWTGGEPGVTNSASFASAGATTNLVTNNIVSTSVTIQQLNYETNNSGYHTTWIQDGVTLTVSNATTGGAQAVQVGGAGNGNDNVFNKPVTNTITGLNGTLLVVGNDPRLSVTTNQINFQVRQCANPAVANQVTLDMSGLGTLIATVGKFYVAQGGSGGAQSNVSGCLYLARTNVITCLRISSGQFEVGDSSGGLFTLPGSALYLGMTNALCVDTMRIGKQKATNNLMCFNPAFTNVNPVAYIRGTNATPTSRMTTWTIADADTEPTVPLNVQADVDFSNGKLDALIGTMIVARGTTNAADTSAGYAQGTLTFTAGTLDVTNLQVGVQRANNAATESGIVNVNGTATLVSTNIMLAQTNAGVNASKVSGTINVTNGTVRGNILAGGGVSTVNINGGTLIVSNNAGTAAAPLTALNFTSGSLHLNVDGNATTAIVNAIAVTTNGTTTITIDAVANVTGTNTIHLISYTGSDPYASLSLAPLPSGYTGTLLDNSGSVDMKVSVAPAVPPTIRTISISSGQLILAGTNNVGASGAGGSYHVLTSTNVALALTNWTVLTNGSFDVNGNFSSTNASGTNSQQFYILKVP